MTTECFTNAAQQVAKPMVGSCAHRFSLFALMIVLVAFASLTYAADALSQTSDFSIEPQDVETALHEWSKQADVQVMVGSAEVAGQRTDGVRGRLTAANALTLLLQDTNLTYQSVGGNTVTVKRIAAAPAAGPQQASHKQTRSQDGGESIGVDKDELRRRSLEEVIVTAQKREQGLTDVPMSIAAVTGVDLAEKGIKNLQDLSYAVPGLNVSEVGPGNQAIIVRGIFSQRGTSSLTGVYLDEMPLSGIQNGTLPAYADVRPIDLKRVEILKGPQGTLFGEGAAGGVVRFITNDPKLDAFGGDLSAEISETESGGWNRSVSGVLNIPLAESLFGVRLAGSYEEKAGWIGQPAINRDDINDAEIKHLRAKALLLPLPNLKITGLVEIHRDTGDGTNTVNLVPERESNFRQAFDVSLPTNYKNDYELYNLTATYDLGFAELLSSTSYATFNANQPLTQLIDGVPNPWLEIWTKFIVDSSITSQEFRLTSIGQRSFRWTVGAAYKDSELRVPVGEAPGVYARLFGGALQQAGANAGVGTDNNSENWAGFVDGSYEFFSKFEVGGGVRYFADEREAASQASPVAPIVKGGTADFEKLTYRVYAKYKPVESVNIYGSFATGFRSGDITAPATVARGASPSVGEENSKFYELGVKATAWDGRLLLNTALFYGKYTDMQETLTALSPVDGNLLTYLINGQDAEIRGVDGDVALAVTDRLTLSLAGAVNDTEIVEIAPGVNSPYRVGDSINQVPKYSLSSTVDYRFAWSGSVPGFLLLTFNHQGKSYYFRRNGTLQTPDRLVNSVPEKDFANVTLGAEWNGWQVSMFARNLFDERDILFPTENSWGSQARPRTYGVAVAKTF